MRKALLLLILGLFGFGSSNCAWGQGKPLDAKDATLPKVQFPEEFAMVFSFGYVTDWMPKDPAVFEKMLLNMKRTGINTVHCKYSDARLVLCEKHGLMMMIDLAVPEHDLKKAQCPADEAKDLPNLDGAEERFAKLKNSLDKIKTRLGEIGQDLNAINMADKANARLAAIDKELKSADAAHKAKLEKEKKSLEMAKARAEKALPLKLQLEEEKKKLQAEQGPLEKQQAIEIVSNVKYICRKVRGSKGVWGYGLYYDAGTNGSYLNHAVEKLRTWDPTHVSFVGSYRHGGLETVTLNPGCYGWYDFHWQRGVLWHYLDMMVLHDICKRRGAIVANYPQYSGLKQDLFTLNQCIAAGTKMTVWFIGGPMSRDKYEWSDKQELVQIAAEVRALYKELMLIGHPSAYYSTPVTKTHDNKPVATPGVPRWFKPFPADCWVQVPSGEAMVGLFKYADGTDALFVANHNAFAPQEMKLKFKRSGPYKVVMFDRKEGGWKPLEVQDDTVHFTLGEGRGELLKLQAP